MLAVISSANNHILHTPGGICKIPPGVCKMWGMENGLHYLIIGGVAGGMSAATRLRRLDENAQITVIERSGHVSFANCGLPYYVGGVIKQRETLLLQTPQSLAARFRLNILVNTEAVAIDPQAHTVTVRRTPGSENATTPESSENSVEVLTYDRLLLSPGARPIMPPIPGIERALPLRDVEDTDRLYAAVRRKLNNDDAADNTGITGNAVVIGGGFIGVEVAENLVHLGLQVTLVEAADQVLAPLDVEMAALVAQRLRQHGVQVLLGSSVSEIQADQVLTSDGQTLAADVVVAAVGVRPDTALAQATGLRLGPRGGIWVDKQLRTSAPDVFAVGDAVEKVDALSGEAALVPLANTANLQGRMVADIMTGLPGKDRSVLGTAIVGVCGLQVATTGWNEKRLRAAGRPYRAIHTHPAAHATYYPGAASISLKLLVDPETDQIVGAQGVGEDGVDKRIDVIATAMAAKLPAAQLAQLELSYAPPFGSAKDPVNMLGYIDRNNSTGMTETAQWHELADLLQAGWHLVDVRTKDEFNSGNIPGAINIPLDELRDRLTELPDGPLLVHCQVGLRGHLAARILAQHGRQVRNLDGGYRTWYAGTVLASNNK